MGIDDGYIVFDRRDNTYHPGDTVRGRLVFRQERPKKCLGIYMKVHGHCYVHWTTTHTRQTTDHNGQSRSENYTKDHTSRETYLETKVYLSGNGRDYHMLPSGKYEIPFECYIPMHCPSSYENRNGFIKYEFKFKLEKGSWFDKKKTGTVNVVARKDLNADPYCKSPMLFKFLESYYNCCVSAGKCEVIVSLPASGFCPGQIIPIEVSVDNKSSVTIEGISLEIKEETKFTAHHEKDVRKEKEVVASLEKGPVPGHTTRSWQAHMAVPYIDVRNVDACKFIDVNYEFKVKVSPAGCHKSSSSSRRLVLGHIPLRVLPEPPPTDSEATIANPVDETDERTALVASM